MKVRQIRIDGDLAYVPLTRGHEAVIDAIDAYLVDGFNWYADLKNGIWYAKRTVNGAQPFTVTMHRILLGDPPGFFIDHRDCNGLNNRRENLRTATVAENNRNHRTRKNNTSGFKGVSLHKQSQRWQASIWADRKIRHLGSFDTPEAAHLAYVAASAELHGDFGRVA